MLVLQMVVPSTSALPQDTSRPRHVQIAVGQFVAVYYSDTFYVGLILKQISHNKFEIKFLSRSGNNCRWPRKDDISVIKKKYILTCNVRFSSSVFPSTLLNIDFVRKMYTKMKYN